ncbi:MAG TPA: hypothetical protein VF510_20285 [Ktedonobacterales bacterium]
MAGMPAANQAAVQTEQRERDAQQLAKLGASPAALLLSFGTGPQGRSSGLTRMVKWCSNYPMVPQVGLHSGSLRDQTARTQVARVAEAHPGGRTTRTTLRSSTTRLQTQP